MSLESQVTNMHKMFYMAFSFNSDLSGWDISQVTDMSFMFSDAKSFNYDLSEWNISSSVDTRHMFFRNARSLTRKN
jgi:surface protein